MIYLEMSREESHGGGSGMTGVGFRLGMHAEDSCGFAAGEQEWVATDVRIGEVDKFALQSRLVHEGLRIGRRFLGESEPSLPRQ